MIKRIMYRPYLRLGSILVICIAFSAGAFAQNADGPPPADGTDRPPNRMELFRSLGLSQEQVRQIRTANAQIQERRRVAITALRTATRELDQAIYADKLDEAVVAERMQQHRDAQAEVSRINFEQELALRKILTPEQLITFRDLRRKMNEARERLQQRREENQARPRVFRRNQDQNPRRTPAKPQDQILRPQVRPGT